MDFNTSLAARSPVNSTAPLSITSTTSTTSTTTQSGQQTGNITTSTGALQIARNNPAHEQLSLTPATSLTTALMSQSTTQHSPALSFSVSASPLSLLASAPTTTTTTALSNASGLSGAASNPTPAPTLALTPRTEIDAARLMPDRSQPNMLGIVSSANQEIPLDTGVTAIRLRGQLRGNSHQELLVPLENGLNARISRESGLDTFQYGAQVMNPRPSARSQPMPEIATISLAGRGMTLGDIHDITLRTRERYPTYNDANCQGFAQHIYTQAGGVVPEPARWEPPISTTSAAAPTAVTGATATTTTAATTTTEP